jgi:hypothetical protein
MDDQENFSTKQENQTSSPSTILHYNLNLKLYWIWRKLIIVQDEQSTNVIAICKVSERLLEKKHQKEEKKYELH